MPLYRSVSAASASSSIGRTVTANTTIAISDMNTTLLVNSASDVVITIDTDANVPIPANAYFEVVNLGSGAVQLSPASGVTALSRGLGAIPQYAGVSVLRLATDSWHVAGEMTTLTGVVYQSYTNQNTGYATQHTFNAAAIGTAQGNRKVVALVATSGPSSNASLNSDITVVTIGGVAATVYAKAHVTNYYGVAFGIFGADIAAGATADIVVDCSGSVQCALATYAVYTDGARQDAQVSATSTSSTSVSTTAAATDIIVAGGYVYGNTTNPTGRFTLSQVVASDVDASFAPNFGMPVSFSSRSLNGAAAGTVTAAATGSSNIACAALVRWTA